MKYLGGVQTEPDAWRTFASWLGIQLLTENAMFSVVERSSGRWIGRIGPWTPRGWPTQEVGWGLLQEFEGKGYAMEAAIACIDHVFHDKNWAHVTHLIADANAASQRLAERLGSQPEELTELPGKLAGHPVRVWRQSKLSWWASRERFSSLVPLKFDPTLVD